MNQAWLWRPLVALAAVAGIASYSVYSYMCKDTGQCNLYHPYIIIFPVISFDKILMFHVKIMPFSWTDMRICLFAQHDVTNAIWSLFILRLVRKD